MARTYHHGERNLTTKRFYLQRGWAWRYFPREIETPPRVKRHREEWHPMGTTPSAWNRLMHLRPQRRACRVLERQALTCELEGWEFPHGHKPHQYYW